MSEPNYFSLYLCDVVADRGISPEKLADELKFAQVAAVKMWLQGKSDPGLRDLRRLIEVLDVDPVEIILGWVINACPELEQYLWDEVLTPRGARFPMSGDQIHRQIIALGKEAFDKEEGLAPKRWSDIKAERFKQER